MQDQDAKIWEPIPSDLKRYKHWDAVIPIGRISELVRNPSMVEKHSFRPLLHYSKTWRRAPIKHENPTNGEITYEKRKPKKRPIRYASRKDAYIYKHYRAILSALYEKEIETLDLGNNILAYRRVPVSVRSDTNKSNINFADDAFAAIRKLGRCCAIAVDIESYFDSIDHILLKKRWCSLLDTDWLPADHFKLFKSLTDYRFVDRDEAFVALGYAKRDADGHLRYTGKPNDIPLQLCSPSEFRDKIVNGNLVKSNTETYGIPQGTPISDLLANLFLIEFDVTMKKFAESRGGFYCRYSDDILILLPGDGRVAKGVIKSITAALKAVGPALQLSSKKTEIVCFTPNDSRHRCYSLGTRNAKKGRQKGQIDRGLSYLGFRFDGNSVYLRNSTVTNLRGKVSRACKAIAFEHVKKHKEKELDWLIEHQPLMEVRQKYLSVEDFHDKALEALQSEGSAFAHLTFWSYVKRAQRVFGERGKNIPRQVRGIDSHIRLTLETEIKKKHHYLRASTPITA